MEHKLTTYTFLEEYNVRIRPFVAGVDVFLKTSDYPLCAADVACVLEIDEREVLSALADIGRNTIDQEAFLAVMERGSSEICRMYAREVGIGSPPVYTADQIAYVYNLDKSLVEDACKKMQIKEVTAFTMPLVFAQIPYAGI